eukprot:GHRQ01022282.1.p2 GENE.GHRQ01022282.1~~GHRQ01022282.1.p2  ORF type:complete len:110 (-),score=13.98 GHRQ01022282.1:224-553(-)
MLSMVALAACMPCCCVLRLLVNCQTDEILLLHGASCILAGAMRNEAYVEKANGFGGKVQRTFSGACGNAMIVPTVAGCEGDCVALGEACVVVQAVLPCCGVADACETAA